jgi:hypothetical protein
VSSVIERSQNAFARSWPRNLELERHGRVLTAEKAEAYAVLPLWMTAHPTDDTAVTEESSRREARNGVTRNKVKLFVRGHRADGFGRLCPTFNFTCILRTN